MLIAELSKQLKAAYKQAKQSKHHKAIVDSKEVTKLTTIVENEHNPDVKDDEYEKELYEDDSEPDASEEEIEAFKCESFFFVVIVASLREISISQPFDGI